MPGEVQALSRLVAPAFVGYVDERSARHVAGWVWNVADPAERVAYEVVLAEPSGERVLARGEAGDWSATLQALDIGDAAHAFRVLFPSEVAEPERLTVRLARTGTPLQLAPALKTGFEPIGHVAMDVVDNCNLRCPFCVYDYSDVRRTQVMAETTFRSALRLLPYVGEGNFWLSCAHEATLHPDLPRLIAMIPRERRDRAMFTTNLAKPLSDAFFAVLGESGLHHLNVSLESLRPEIYERMRKGARFRVFEANWAKLLRACRAGPAPPRLRYNLLAYRSNLDELPGLVETLLAEKQAWQVEIRYTFDQLHIPQAFRDAEYLDDAGWRWLADRLAHHDPSRVLLMRPPEAAAEAPPSERPSYPLGMTLQWDGTLTVYSVVIGLDRRPRSTKHLITNVLDVADAAGMIAGLLC